MCNLEGRSEAGDKLFLCSEGWHGPPGDVAAHACCCSWVGSPCWRGAAPPVLSGRPSSASLTFGSDNPALCHKAPIFTSSYLNHQIWRLGGHERPSLVQLSLVASSSS